MQIIGLDIGGANLKAADNDGRCVTRVFEIWKRHELLQSTLAEIVAVTMTAELADCFETKSQGVDFILTAVERVAGSAPVDVWQTGAEFVCPDVAREIPMLVAAANWHAQATWVGRMVPQGAALLIDIGTTTTDIIPLWNGVPVPEGLTDSERLRSGELVYTGIRRTPICAVTQTVPLRGRVCPVAAELFATTLDVYILLGEVAENSDDCDTANGRAATRTAARDRIARMVCCDRLEITTSEAREIAEYVAALQREKICMAIDMVLARQKELPPQILISGSGSFLARSVISQHPRLAQSEHVSIVEAMGPELSEAACAYAVARLASERFA